MIKLKVPATSANIGSGFDSLGLCLNLYNYVDIEQADGVFISSADSTPVPTTEDNLIFSSAKYIYDLCGKKFTGLKIVQQNNIPMTRGLGSSSACIVAGVYGANELLGKPLAKDDIVDICATIESHPDNTTPAILGGLVTSVFDGKKVHFVKQAVTNELQFVAIIPNFELKTNTARELLPDTISLKDAIFNLSRAALLSSSLLDGKYENIRTAVEDKIHQPYRLDFINGAHDVFEKAYEFGAYGIYISGAGSTLMAITKNDDGVFYDKMKKSLGDMGFGVWNLHSLHIDNVGISVV